MFFRLMILSLIAVSAKTTAQTETTQIADPFTALPDTCVALREGRNCYADIELNWQLNQVGNYCIRHSESKHIMQCWLKQSTGSMLYQFNNATSESFELINSDNGKVIASAQVQLQWVYESRQKKRRWRLF